MNFEKNHPVRILKKITLFEFWKKTPCMNFEKITLYEFWKSLCMNFKKITVYEFQKITLCEFWKFWIFFDNFDNCWQIWQFLKQSCRLVTIETLITILTIENLNSWQSLLPDNQEWHWTAFAILAMFKGIWQGYERIAESIYKFINNIGHLQSLLYGFYKSTWTGDGENVWLVGYVFFGIVTKTIQIFLDIFRRVYEWRNTDFF